MKLRYFRDPFTPWNYYIRYVNTRRMNLKSQFSFFFRFRYFKDRISLACTFTMLY